MWWIALALGCGPALDPSAWLPGGDGTNTVLLGSNSYAMPAQNLTADHEQDFYSGNSFFNQSWVEAPSSTAARDGLGPLFNARSCSGCHLRDGRGAPPDDGQAPFVGVLLRLSVDGPDGPEPHPVYGGQLQDDANPEIAAEASPRITWTELEGRYADGTAHSRVAPTYHLDAPAYGPLDGVHVSPRVAPQMIGLGLLESIDAADIEALADPDDADGDGISGRVQRREDPETGHLVVGRFGWKGDAPTLAAQVAGAFAGDMGLTSRLHPVDDCTDAQPDCLAEPTGDDADGVEVSDDILDLVVLYARSLAVPARRMADDKDVLRGERLFHDAGCAACHVPDVVTGAGPMPEHVGQHIWPYTDLLLHDMGPGLADGAPVGEASGVEWKTPPLWGLGLLQDVSGHTRYLHDGRARSLEEAILWHGGEATAAREAFAALDVEERDAVLQFLRDL